MEIPVELRALRAFVARIRDGLPFSEAYRVVGREAEFAVYAAAGDRLLQGAPLVETVPGLPPAFRSILRWGERTGQPTQAIEHIAQWWLLEKDVRLPLCYLSHALGGSPLGEILEEGRDVFAIDRDWSAFAALLKETGFFAAASQGKPRILPRPLPAVLAAAERSGNLSDLFRSIWEGSQRGWIPYETAKDRSLALTQTFYCWSLLLEAGLPVQESLDALGPSKEFEGLRAEDFVPSLNGRFTPSVRALLQKAYECGDLVRTLRHIVEDQDFSRTT